MVADVREIAVAAVVFRIGAAEGIDAKIAVAAHIADQTAVSGAVRHIAGIRIREVSTTRPVLGRHSVGNGTRARDVRLLLTVARSQVRMRRIRHRSRTVKSIARVSRPAPATALRAPGRALEAKRFLELAADIQRIVAVQDPLKAKGVEVFLHHFDETRLNLDELRLTAELVQHLLELSEVLARVADVELAE